MSQIEDPERFIELMVEIQDRADAAKRLVNVEVSPGLSGIHHMAGDLQSVGEIARMEQTNDGDGE